MVFFILLLINCMYEESDVKKKIYLCLYEWLCLLILENLIDVIFFLIMKK